MRMPVGAGAMRLQKRHDAQPSARACSGRNARRHSAASHTAAAAAGITLLAFVVTAEIVPRTNARLANVLAGTTTTPSDRSMTIGALRAAANNFEATADAFGRSRAAAYRVEIQKKLALPAACLLLAMAGMALAFRIPRAGLSLVIGASLVCFGAYYGLIMTGEVLAEQLVVSPFVGMWGANAFVLTVALLAMWRRRGNPDGMAIRT